MRCKNCGTYNDDNRYICETCGSPLYDEEDINAANTDNDKTQTFGAINVSEPNNEPLTPPEPPISGNNDGNKNGDKKSTIAIAILVVVLIAIVASIVVVAQSNKKKNEIEDTTPTQIQTTESTTEPSTEYTTESTTESTTKPTTTESTTTKQTWYINVSSSGGGTVSGAGEYENGEKVTLIATADSDYTFDGWYSNGVKVSNKLKYTFTANENASFSAVFNPVPVTDQVVEDLNGDDE